MIFQPLYFIRRGCRFPLPAAILSLAAAGNAGATPEPQLVAARHLASGASPACAAVQLLAAEQDYELESDSVEDALTWLRDYGRLNHFNRADKLSQLLGNKWDTPRHNAFWLQQARLMLHRGEISNVEHALRRLREPVKSGTEHARASLWGHVLLQQRRFAEAARMLETITDESDGSPFDQYNLALALIGQYKSAPQGRKLLDELSQRPTENAEALALRDRINLTLGWSWLAAQKGGTARPYFKRVRLDGPDSSMALLGMGWAELAPNGRQQVAPVFMGFYHEFAFEPAIKGAERFLRALKPWQVLKRRAPHEPAVQEALQAIAYTYARLGKTEAAASAYRHAIRKYQAEIARLDALGTRLRVSTSDPRLVVERSSRASEFGHVAASQAFAGIQAEIEALQYCAHELDDIRSIAAPYQRSLLDHLAEQTGQMQAAHALLMDELRQLYLADIAMRRGRLRAYLANASFSLARLQDLGSAH